MIKFWLIVLVGLSWVFPVHGVIYNQINPNYGSALGVVYGFAIGCVINIIGFLLWIVIRRSNLQKSEAVVLLISLVFLAIATVVGNDGSLSKVG